ncbi:hypothetical protein diail_4288 [Diaporthe ilicicola]|nr:hypothetical protein diail_4288 [Diaporthe ilicicola]
MLRTFHCFGELPVELQKTVWEAAASALPMSSIQRFTVEIVQGQRDEDSNSPPRHLVCFQPHTDFIKGTARHRDLLRACHESRAAALSSIGCLLPIHYLTRDSTGTLVSRQGSVPFNPSGHFCISGLRAAIEHAIEGRGARGSSLLPLLSRDIIFEYTEGLEGSTSSLIENLTIALERTQDNISVWEMYVFDSLASKLRNLKTISYTSEGVLDRRHHLSQQDFDDLHQTLPAHPETLWLGLRYNALWYGLWARWTLAKLKFEFLVRSERIKMSWSGHEDSVLKRELDMNMWMIGE